MGARALPRWRKGTLSCPRHPLTPVGCHQGHADLGAIDGGQGHPAANTGFRTHSRSLGPAQLSACFAVSRGNLTRRGRDIRSHACSQRISSMFADTACQEFLQDEASPREHAPSLLGLVVAHVSIHADPAPRSGPPPWLASFGTNTRQILRLGFVLVADG